MKYKSFQCTPFNISSEESCKIFVINPFDRNVTIISTDDDDFLLYLILIFRLHLEIVYFDLFKGN